MNFSDYALISNEKEDRKNGKFRDDLEKITRLQLPHRLNDLILRNIKVEDDDKGQTMRVDFHKSKIGKRMDTANIRNTTPIFQFCSISIPFPKQRKKNSRQR